MYQTYSSISIYMYTVRQTSKVSSPVINMPTIHRQALSWSNWWVKHISSDIGTVYRFQFDRYYVSCLYTLQFVIHEYIVLDKLRENTALNGLIKGLLENALGRNLYNLHFYLEFFFINGLHVAVVNIYKKTRNIYPTSTRERKNIFRVFESIAYFRLLRDSRIIGASFKISHIINQFPDYITTQGLNSVLHSDLTFVTDRSKAVLPSFP